MERHQTLRAAIDWSYELLSEGEQLVLTRLSIFAGGFSLEAAEAVTRGGAVETDEVFEHLATLVARSLVVADTEGVDTRYRLLETIRQYAQEHLDTSGDGDRLRAEHAAYYAGFSETAIANATGPDGIEWERRFQHEFDNFRAATDLGDGQRGRRHRAAARRGVGRPDDHQRRERPRHGPLGLGHGAGHTWGRPRIRGTPWRSR